MKQSLLVVFLVSVLIIGCSVQKERLIDYNARSLADIPDVYPDGSFSVGGFLDNRFDYDNESVIIRGIVTYKYVCPSCPKGALCIGCINKYILFVDPLENITYENQWDYFRQPRFQTHRVSINFFKDDEVYDDIVLGEELRINVSYTTQITGVEGVRGERGYFVYNSLDRVKQIV